MVAQRARSFVRATVERIQGVLRDHVEAVDRLAREGRDLLHLIDQTVLGIAVEASSKANVGQLFGQAPPLKIAQETNLLSPIPDRAVEVPPRRRPTFD